MRTLVEIQRITAPRDDRRGVEAKWEKLTKAWVAVETATLSETESGQRLEAEGVLVLRTHWSPGMAQIDTTMRVVMNGRTLHIRSAVDVNLEHRMIELVCVDRTPPALLS